MHDHSCSDTQVLPAMSWGRDHKAIDPNLFSKYPPPELISLCSHYMCSQSLCHHFFSYDFVWQKGIMNWHVLRKAFFFSTEAGDSCKHPPGCTTTATATMR